MKKDETIDINIISINEALVLARNSKKVELIQLIETNFNKINKLMQDLSFNIQTSRGYERYYHEIVSELDFLNGKLTKTTSMYIVRPSYLSPLGWSDVQFPTASGWQGWTMTLY